MGIESLFHDLLGLGTDWRVKELAHLPGAHSEVHIVIEATAGLCERYKCPDDGGSVRHYDDAPVRKWRHLNIFQHEKHPKGSATVFHSSTKFGFFDRLCIHISSFRIAATNADL